MVRWVPARSVLRGGRRSRESRESRKELSVSLDSILFYCFEFFNIAQF
jgi:hypothetical protein